MSSQQQILRSNATQLSHYQLLEKVGDGTFGVVILALDKTMSNTRVALKKMKTEYRNKDEGDREREVRTLRRLRQHKNIVRLYATFFENGVFYIAYEYMDANLLDLIRGVHQNQQAPQQSRAQRSGLPEHSVRMIMFQVFAGLEHLHRHGYFHRDMKPENILCNGPEVVKICDFGLAKEIRSSPPFTTYISTRWYRAPELLLSALTYNTPIDIWACGCIMFECFTGNPLFPGKTDIDMVHKICARLGDPKEGEWPDGHKLIKKKGLKFPVCTPVNFALLFAESGSEMTPPTNNNASSTNGKSSSAVSAEAVTIIRNILRWNPVKRIGAGQILRHAYFASVSTQLKSTQSDGVSNGTADPEGTFSPSVSGTSRTTPTAKLHSKTVQESPLPKSGLNNASRAGAAGKKNSVAGDRRQSSVVAPSSTAARNDSSKTPKLSHKPALSSVIEPHSVSGVDNSQQASAGPMYKSAVYHSNAAGATTNGIGVRNNSITSEKIYDGSNKRAGVGRVAANDTIYEYATSNDDDAETILAAAAVEQQQQQRRNSWQSEKSESVLKLLDSATNNARQPITNNNERAVHGNNTKLLNDLFRDMDESSTSVNVQGEQKIRHGAPPLARSEHPAAAFILERSKTTSPPQMQTARQRQARYVHDRLFGPASNKQHHSPDSNKTQQVNVKSSDSRSAKLSLDNLFPADATPNTNNASNGYKFSVGAQNSKSKLIHSADIFSSMPPPLSLDGKRVALKKSSTEFSIRDFSLNHGNKQYSSKDFNPTTVSSLASMPPVTTDPLATLNHMLLHAGVTGGNGTTITSEVSQRPVVDAVDDNGKENVYSAKLTSGASYRRNSNGMNLNGLHQEPHLTDWSRKYPQWK